MDKRAFKTLEFDKNLSRLAAYTESEQVKSRILNLEPFISLDDAQSAQRETAEAVSAILKMGAPPVNLSVRNVNGAVRRRISRFERDTAQNPQPKRKN